jgi:hypothetical protein
MDFWRRTDRSSRQKVMLVTIVGSVTVNWRREHLLGPSLIIEADRPVQQRQSANARQRNGREVLNLQT